jgi:ABC-2 type transport system permease protein
MKLPVAYSPFFDAILENFAGWGLGMLLVIGADILFVASLVLLLIIILFLPRFRFRQAAFAVFKRNFVGYFNSPIGYVFLCLFVLLTSLAAFWPHEFFASNLANLDQLNRWLPYIMLTFIPAITMSTWADEKRQGTDELLLTLPATDFDIVIGKYFACVGVFTVSLVFSQIWNYCVLAALTAGTMDVGLIMTTYLGYWFIGLSMLALGMVASFLTRNLTIGFIFGIVLNAPLAFLADIDLLLPNSWLLNQIQQWSLLARFDSFGRGIIAIAPVFYFVGIVVLGIYVSLVMIGRRHWSGARDGVIRLLHYLARIACIIVIAIGLTLIGQYTFLNQLRSDQSEGRVSSLSDETRAILKKLSQNGGDQSPIVIDAYVSDNVPPEYVRTRYDLVNLLREFDVLGGDRIMLNLYTGVEPFSETADTAEKSFKISPVEVVSRNRGMVRTERLVMGASFRCGLERVTIPFFSYGSPVEYELIRSINTVASSKRKTIGVVRTNANLMGETVYDAQRQQYVQANKQAIITELEQQYEVQSVDATLPIEVWTKDQNSGSESLRYDVLIVAQPSSLSAVALKNLVDALQQGQPTAVFEDPYPWFYPSVYPTSVRPQGSAKGDIDTLWRALGIDGVYKLGSNNQAQSAIIWQDYNPYPQIEEFTKTPEYVFVRQLPDVLVTDRSFSEESPITSGLEEILFPAPGAIIRRNEETEFEPLVVTGTAGSVPFDDWNAVRNQVPVAGRAAERQLEAIRQKPDQRYVLAAELRRKARPATTPQSPSATNPASESANQRDMHVVYVADLDMLESNILRFWKFPEIEERGTVFRMQNTIFLLNLVDHLAGEENTYVKIRTRQRGHRTLRRIEQLIEQEQANVNASKQEKERLFKDAIATEQAKITEELKPLETLIQRMRQSRETDPAELKLRENQLRLKTEAIGKKLYAKEQQLELAKDQEIRDIERKTEIDIQRMQTDFKVWSAVLPPILPMLIGFIVYAKRRLREREGVSKARLR